MSLTAIAHSIRPVLLVYLILENQLYCSICKGVIQRAKVTTTQAARPTLVVDFLLLDNRDFNEYICSNLLHPTSHFEQS